MLKDDKKSLDERIKLMRSARGSLKRPGQRPMSEWWPEYVAKLNGNAERDKRHRRALKKLGWKVIVIWECEAEKTDSELKLF